MRTQVSTIGADAKILSWGQNGMSPGFALHLAHDLRNPVSALMGMVELLRQPLYGALNDDQRQCLDNIQAGLDQLMYLTDDLSDTARIAEGTLELDLSRVTLADVLAAIEGHVSRSAFLKGLELTLECPPDPVVLHADRHRLQQVVVGLLAMTMKAAPRGSKVLLKAAVRKNILTIGISATSPGNAVLLHRAGIGGPGQQPTPERMALICKLAEAHGGRVLCAASEKTKVKYVVTLPIRQSALPAGNASDPKAPWNDNAAKRGGGGLS